MDAVNAYNEKNGTGYPAIGFGNKDSWLGELLYTMIVNATGITPGAGAAIPGHGG